MRFTRESTFFPGLGTDKFCDKAAITSQKNNNARTKMAL